MTFLLLWIEISIPPRFPDHFQQPGLVQHSCATLEENLTFRAQKYNCSSVVLLIAVFVIAPSLGAQKQASKQTQAARQNSPAGLQQAPAANTGITVAPFGNDDPDLPSFATKIDKKAYLEMRSRYILRLRGVSDPSKFDPHARSRAIQVLERQERQLRFNRAESSFGGQTPMGGQAPLSSTVWNSIGPAPIPNGQTSPVEVPVSGRVTAIAVHPTNSNIVYVGTAQGGLYRTLDGGLSWTPLMDNAQSLAIGAVTIDPINPSTVFVGTGEGNGFGDSFFGVGLYRIDNADSSPVLNGPFEARVAGTGTGASNGHAFAGTSITKIVVDPANDNRIFMGNTIGTSGLDGGIICCGGINPASAFIGLYFSGNALAANPVFSRVSGVPGNGLAGVTDIVMEPSSSNNMLVSSEDFAANSPNTGVYRTTNAGAASQNPSISPTFSNTLSTLSGKFVNIKLSINKTIAGMTLLAGTEEANGTLYRSMDGGATWSAPLLAANGFCSTQCSYDLVVTIKPDDANIFFLGGSAGNFNLQKTADGGVTFPRLNNSTLHADTHAVVYAPSNLAVMYDGNDGGIWRSNDGGASWTSLNNAGFNATQFQSMALHPLDRQFMIGGTQDNGTELLNPDGTWFRADFGDGGYSEIDQNALDTNNVTMYHTYFNLPNQQIGYAQSSSGVNAQEGFWNFSGCANNISSNGITCTDSVLFYAPLALGPGNPNAIYFGTDHLYRSTDTGITNTIVSQNPMAVGPNGNIPISAIGISPQNDNVRIVGMRNGQVFATTNGSTTLTDVTPFNSSFTNSYIARAVVDPNNSNTAYVTLDNYGLPLGQHVWKTTNLAGGAGTWAPAGNGIPDVPVNALVVDPLDSNLLYAGTDIGVYNSTDGGQSWNPYRTGLPRVAVFDIAIQSPSRVLRVATHGRGIWETAAQPAVSVTALNALPNPSVFGQAVTFTASVGSFSTRTPTGTVTFMDGATTLGVGILNGQASLAIGTLTAGVHSVRAIYNGDSTFAASASFPVNQTVNQASTTTGLISSGPSPSIFGQAVTFTTTISVNNPGTGTPTGTVTFKDGANTLGAGTVDGSGHATFTAMFLSVGSHSVTAAYSGDSNFVASGSQTVPQNVNQASTSTVVTASPNPGFAGNNVTLTAKISATVPGAGDPSGTVTFLDSGTALGTGTVSRGVATFTTTTLSVGSHSIRAKYNGDTSFLISTSLPITININPSTFVVTATHVVPVNPAPARIGGFGGNVHFVVTVTNKNATSSGAITVTTALTGKFVLVSAISVQLSCSVATPVVCTTSGLPANSSASIDIQLIPTGGNAITATTTLAPEGENETDTVKVRFRPFRF